MTSDDLDFQIKEARLRKSQAAAEREELALLWERRQEENRKAHPDLRRTYLWYGPVSMTVTADAIESLDRWSLRDPREPIRIVFNSPGGDVVAGFALYDFIQKVKTRGCHVTTVASGLTASMAAILLQAGDTRLIDPRASLLIHEISYGSSGRMTEMEIELEYAKRLQRAALDILSERATLTRRTIENRWKKGDWWLTASEAIKTGLADGYDERGL